MSADWAKLLGQTFEYRSLSMIYVSDVNLRSIKWFASPPSSNHQIEIQFIVQPIASYLLFCALLAINC